MKNWILFLIPILLLLSCNNAAVEKPDNLIDEDQMADIIYDLALLDAIRASDPNSLVEKNITAHEYIYSKYKIDSLQFVQSNHYYAADVHNYLKLYERVQQRLDNNKTELDSLIVKSAKTPKKPAVKTTEPANDTDAAGQKSGLDVRD